jgi:Ca-activated chloride channel homolog
LLRNSKFKSAASFEMVTELANNALGKDPEGYRKEFVDLVEKAAALKEGLGKR